MANWLCKFIKPTVARMPNSAFKERQVGVRYGESERQRGQGTEGLRDGDGERQGG